VLAFAKEEHSDLVERNHALDVDYFKSASYGHHSWTLDEIAQFEARHAIGTKARPSSLMLIVRSSWLPKKSVKYTLPLHGVSDLALARFQNDYTNEKIAKEDVFYFLYGLFHHNDYCSGFEDNLRQELPRVPKLKRAADFWEFARAGRQLADLHCGYNSAPLAPITFPIR
jgi:predicted helicase